MLPIEDGRSLAQLFHLNSEPWLNTDAYGSESYGISHKRVGPRGAAIPLPALPPADGLRGLLSLRGSCRYYQAKPLSLEVLGEVLGGAFGLTRVMRLPDGVEMQTRAAPSAGGLYPLELYAFCRNVTRLRDGAYHYGLLEHVLEPLHDDAHPGILASFLLAEPLIRHANAIVFLTAVFDRTLRKYGPRGYRYILLEAGHVAQNLCLLAVERSLGSLCIGGFMDGPANRFLRIDGAEEAAIYAVAIGYPGDPPETSAIGGGSTRESPWMKQRLPAG